MIKIATLTMNPFGENTYVLYADNGDCVIVDAGCYTKGEQDRLATFIAQNSLTPTLALNTHAHIDHVCGVEWLKNTYGVPFALHAADMPVLESVVTYGEAVGIVVRSVPAVDRYIASGDLIDLGGEKLRIIHTPGHTAGGVSIYIESQKMLLTGDTLFRESIGRTDLPTGDYEQLMQSIIENILPLGSDVTFFPGHGAHSTLGHEVERNPFVSEVLAGDIPYSGGRAN